MQTANDPGMQESSRRVRQYISTILILCMAAGAAVLGITAIKPDTDNTGLIATMLGIFSPVVAALMAMAMKENHDAMNSRLTQLLELTAKASKAEGVVAGKATTIQ